MKVEVIYQGFPGKLSTGYMNWSTVVYIETQGIKILFDTAGSCRRSDIHNRLGNVGLKAEDIDILVLSHFHEDHVYNFDYFKNAKVIMHKAEAEWVESDPDAWPIPKPLYPALVATGRLELISEDKEIAPGVSTLFTPGHSPGGISLVLKDKDMPTTVVAGDAVKNLVELATGKVAMSWNNDLSAESIAKIREIAEIVIPGHDRILKLTPDKVMATTSLHETITVPAGVADMDKERCIELVIEPSWLPRT